MNSDINTNTGITNLQALYKADFSHISEGVLRSLEATEEIQQLRHDIKTTVPNSDWRTIRSEIIKEMEQLLDIELYPILKDSWKTHQDVSREIEAQQESSDSEVNTVSIVNLDQHEIKSTHSPYLSINMGDKTHLLRVFIGITLNLNNVTLVLKNGEIDEVVSGTVDGKGFMQYQNATLIEKDFLQFDIAGITGAAINVLNKENRSSVSDPSNNELSNKNKKNTEQQANNALSNKLQTSPLVPAQQISQPNSKPNAQPISPPRRKSVFSKLLQFIIGVVLALFAVYLFWTLR